MTEVEQLKKRIKELEKLLETSKIRVTLLEETLSTVDKYKVSVEIGEYIRRQQNAIRMAEFLSSISDVTIDTSYQKDSISNLQKQQESINSQINATINKPETYLIQGNGNTLRNLKYESNENGITITKCTTYSPIEIVIPDLIDGKKVTRIGEKAFANQPITSVVLPRFLKDIGFGAFSNCKRLKKVINLNCDIGNDAFKDCRQLSKIDIGEGITTIGNYAFGFCSSLGEFTFGKELRSMGYSAFRGCSRLANADLQNTQICELKGGCFAESGIKNISFPKTLRRIKSWAFVMTKLPGIIIPDYIEEVDGDFTDLNTIAFEGMTTSINSFPNHDIVVYCKIGSKVQQDCQDNRITWYPLSNYTFF